MAVNSKADDTIRYTIHNSQIFPLMHIESIRYHYYSCFRQIEFHNNLISNNTVSCDRKELFLKFHLP